jgi:hypothetical protein
MFQQLKKLLIFPLEYIYVLCMNLATMIIYIHKINWLVSVTEVDRVVRNWSMYIIWTIEVFKGVAINGEALPLRQKKC